MSNSSLACPVPVPTAWKELLGGGEFYDPFPTPGVIQPYVLSHQQTQILSKAFIPSSIIFPLAEPSPAVLSVCPSPILSEQNSLGQSWQVGRPCLAGEELVLAVGQDRQLPPLLAVLLWSWLNLNCRARGKRGVRDDLGASRCILMRCK